MHPTLIRIGSVEIGTHDVFVVLGAVVAVLVFRHENRRRGVDDPRLWTIAAGAMLTGAVFAKLGTGWRYLAENPEPSLVGLWVHGGKSVLGGLAGAYVGALVTKRLIGYPHRTGDLFAPAVALGIAVGRIGCFLTEPIGTPTSMPWGITVSPEVGAQIPNCPQCATGVPLHPSFLYEIAALLGLYALLRLLQPRIDVPGELFKLFLLGYGSFRFAVEFVRGNDTFALGLSGSQVFLLMTMPLLFGYFAGQLARHAYTRHRVAEPHLVAGDVS
jgi:prolipoprotein diacylglyceryltransferase